MAKVAILTTFQEFNPGYSLTGIVRDQCEMLIRHGNQVFLYVNEQFKGNASDLGIPGIVLCKDIPFTHLIDYESKNDITEEHKAVANRLTETLVRDFTDLGIDFAFTHDFIFTGWNLPYALGLQAIGTRLRNVGWLHWVHSVPSGQKDWWDIIEYGPLHRIAYPNRIDSMRVGAAFRGSIESLRVIPHIKDIRTFFDFKSETRELIDAFPGLMSASFVQIYPASTDRLDHKRVDMVIKMFGEIKRMGYTVFLMIANQWATGVQRKEDLNRYVKLVEEAGLIYGKDFVFTSEIAKPSNNGIPAGFITTTDIKYDSPYENGIPREILRELMMLSNIFFFPTREESFGLVLPEVALASGALCILNRSLRMQIEISHSACICFDFGSYENEFNPDDLDEYLQQVARISVGRFSQNESLVHRTLARQKYNMDNLYNQYYLPIIHEVSA